MKNAAWTTALALSLVSPAALWCAGPLPPPEWARHLVVYEVATRGFTSPDGPESGTFASAAAKLPYLHDLGVDGIWLSGHNLADPRHFYGIWTQYATVRPDVIDPALGGAEGLERLVSAAHALGIRVFLDVVTHGVTNTSVREHPGWFRGGSWGMTDYDWAGGHADLDDWWVRTHADLVTRQGVDGFRLDVAIQRPDLWLRIKEEAARAGHPIVVFLEPDGDCGGACDFRQRQTTLSVQTRGLDPSNLMLRDVGAYFAEKLRAEAASPEPKLSSTQLSSHDDGWEGFPAGSDPYVAEGSRAVFGYSCLLAPAIPIFMSGEEWHARFVPLPGLTPDLYGKGERGKGTWLYGSWIHWDQRDEPEAAAMRADVRKLIAIRRAEKELLFARTNRDRSFVRSLGRRDGGRGPVPYVVWGGRRAIVVAANDGDRDVTVSVAFPTDSLGAARPLVVTDLWGAGAARVEGDVLTFPVRRDRVPGGGVAVHRVEWR
jgi:Alpha amylase, catalytic domain